jgi:GTPase SAR1 family protein
VRKAEATLVKEKIVSEAESLVDSVAWKVTTARLKVLLEDWKKAPRLDKKVDAALWKRFSSSRNKFDKRRRTHFANLAIEQKEVASTKEVIVKEAESLANSKEWLNTAKRFKALMDQWKASGRGKKSTDTALWSRFKAAQDTFFAAKNADMEKRKGSMSENLTKREALIIEFEALLPISDFKSAKKKFYDLMGKWQKIGMTDRKKREAFEKRIKKVEEEISELERNYQRKSDPSAKAQANKVVQGLQEAIENYEKQAAKAEAAGQSAKAMLAREAAAARRDWLEQAQKGLTEFTS